MKFKATMMVLGSMALVAGATTTAQAHISASATSTAAGSNAVVSFAIPHGCDGSATTSVTIEIPEGINSVTPTRHAFYDVATVIEDLDEPATDGHGNEINQRVSQVTYTAVEPLPDGQRDVLELAVLLPDDGEGQTLHFPTLQVCEEGELHWAETPAEGQDPHDLAYPAPGLTITEGTGHHHGDHGDHADHGDEHAHHDHGGASDSAWAVAGLVTGGIAAFLAIVALRRLPARE